MPTSSDECPCGSGESFAVCCEPHIDGVTTPSTALALMRSRYTAYVIARFDYVRKTWHPDTCPAIMSPLAERRWLGLKIRSVVDGTENDDVGMVEFVARSKRAGRAERLHETSYFERIDGQWLYKDGIINRK